MKCLKFQGPPCGERNSYWHGAFIQRASVNKPVISQNTFGSFTASSANFLEHKGFQLSKGSVEIKINNATETKIIKHIHSKASLISTYNI